MTRSAADSATAVQPAERPAPNQALRALLAETEWTQEAFARALGRLGAESGVRLSYDRTSVARWLRGSRPAPHVQRFLAEALSRRLGRPVTVDQLGMGDGTSGGPGRRARRTPRGTTAFREGADAELAGGAGARTADAGDRLALCADRLAALTAPVVGPPRADAPAPVPYRLALLGPAEPSPEHATADGTPPPGGARHPDTEDSPYGPNPPAPAGTSPDTPSAPRAPSAPDATPPPAPHGPRPPRAPFPTIRRGGRPTRRTTPGEVASVREHVRFFAAQTDRHGGGHIEAPLAACLAELVRRLRSGGDGPHHAQLLAGAARLGYLLARVYADEQRHGLAQRAFLTAADLAREGGDPDGVALARRALGSQAHQLGHLRHSLALAESACQAAGGGTAAEGTGPSARSFLYSGLAVARAACGERTAALDALRRAEHELARAPVDLTTGPDSPDGEPVGAYQDAALLYQTSRVRVALGDRDGAIRELRASLRLRPSGERRTRAISHAELAELLLARGRLDEACASWQVFLDDCALIRSGRARRARDRLPRLLRPYAHEDCVQALSARTGLALAAPPGRRPRARPGGRGR